MLLDAVARLDVWTSLLHIFAVRHKSQSGMTAFDQTPTSSSVPGLWPRNRPHCGNLSTSRPPTYCSTQTGALDAGKAQPVECDSVSSALVLVSSELCDVIASCTVRDLLSGIRNVVEIRLAFPVATS